MLGFGVAPYVDEFYPLCLIPAMIDEGLGQHDPCRGDTAVHSAKVFDYVVECSAQLLEVRYLRSRRPKMAELEY